MDEGKLREILGQNLEVPDMVNKKLEETYALAESGQRPAGRRRLRPLRTVLIAVAAIALLCGTAAAATVIARQSRTHLIHSEEEKWDVIESALENSAGENGAPAAVAIGGGFNGAWDYKTDADGAEDWWNAYGNTPLEEVEGTPEDGWTKMRKFQREGALEYRYLGETISDFSGLWDGTPINASWLEEQYAAVSGTQRAYMKFVSGQKQEFSFSGAFQGQEDAAFTVEVSQWNRPFANTTFQMTEGYDHVELYETSDGVEVLVKMGTSDSGKSVFWALFTAGCNDFGMWGTEMELEDIRAVLDSLELSNLLWNS